MPGHAVELPAELDRVLAVVEAPAEGGGGGPAVHSTVQYSTVQYSKVQYSTVQYSTVQYRVATIPGAEAEYLERVWLVGDQQ